MHPYFINVNTIDIKQITKLVQSNRPVVLSINAKKNIINCRKYLENKITKSNEAIYGVNTGFGALYNRRVANENLETLQKNLIISHACGAGSEVPTDIVKLMLILKIQSFVYGHSGIDISTVNRLIDLYNHNILPVVYQQGSLGASGDLVPLAHLTLPLIGYGEVHYKNKKQISANVLKAHKWDPLHLKPKEGLAMINGTQFMSAYAVWCLTKARELITLSNLIAALSLEAFNCRLEPFDKLIQKVRKHKGQQIIADNIRSFLTGSQIARSKKEHLQDPYSFRCIPQVHGASYDAIEHVTSVVQAEINSVSDNPNIFVKENKIISGGNFHGQSLAITLDYLSIALAELGSISERRTYLLLSGQRNLPIFLIDNHGLNSGLMITQYTAASIVSENKQLCTPASVDSIVSSNGQEDHVSMGANAATKAYRIVENLEKILAIELMNSAQAIEFRKPLKTSPLLQKLLSKYRKTVPFLTSDRVLYDDLQKTIKFIREVNEFENFNV